MSQQPGAASTCLFCRVAAGTVPATIVHSDDTTVAFRDINPQAPTHILLISRRHVDSIADLTPEDGPLLASIFIVATKLAHELGLDQRGYRIVANNGPDAGQSVFHLHFHLLGGRKSAWPPG